jgi:hypothetical protein
LKKYKTTIIAIIIILLIFIYESVTSFIESKETLANAMFDFANNIRLIIVK